MNAYQQTGDEKINVAGWILAEWSLLMRPSTSVGKFHSGIVIPNSHATVPCQSATARCCCKASGRQYAWPCHRGVEASRFVAGGKDLEGLGASGVDSPVLAASQLPSAKPLAGRATSQAGASASRAGWMPSGKMGR